MAKFTRQEPGPETDFTGEARIDIAISENGASSCVRRVEQMAAVFQRIDPGVAASLRGQALNLHQHLESIVKGAAKVALQAAVKATPEDTSLARSNWTVKVNQSRPASVPTKELDPGGERSIQEGLAVIDNTERQPGQVYWISNSAHHITALERGHSTQAPNGMTKIAKLRAENYVRRRQRESMKGK